MTFGEKLRRGRSHLLIVVIMIVTAAIVVGIEDENLAQETGKRPPERRYPAFSQTMPEPGGDPAPAGDRAEASPGTGEAAGPVVQLGAYLSREDAMAGWERLVDNPQGHGSLELDGVEPEIVAARAAGGTVHRLLIRPRGPMSAAQMCREFQALDIACFVREP